jgi:type IV secretory pathway VirD2 relaxase
MTRDDDFFEPYAGRSRGDGGSAPTGVRTQLMRGVARAGGNPRRLRSVLPTAKPARATGRFNARGRGAKIAATFPRGSGWSFDRGSGMRVRPRRVTVKARVVKARGQAGGVRAHLRYLEREGVTREGEPGRLYSTFTDEADREAFIERGLDDRHEFRFIISPEDSAAYRDLKPFTREVMARMEADLETTLDWVAVDHHDTGHPHVHVVVRGITEDGKTLNIAGDYIAHGVRHRASEVLTRDLGPQTEWEVQKQLESEVEAERLTRLDRTLIERAEDGAVDLRLNDAGADLGEAHHQLLVARARRLERMGLAEAKGPLQWSLAPQAEDVLRSMGERGDIIKTLHRAMTQAQVERSPELYAIHVRGQALGQDTPIVGRIIARGLSDELADRRYLVIDGIDGRSHYVDIGATDAKLPVGSVVGVSDVSTEPRKVDRTVAEIAAAHGGHYTLDIHLSHDPSASEAFAETHVRRLEAIRRATGGVERERDGTWIVAPDHLDRVRAYEQQRAQAEPMAIETLSSQPIERQIGADGPTWLDRQIVHDANHDLAGHGFGRDVRSAMAQRRQWLIEQGLMWREGSDIVYRTNLLDQLRRRELLRTADQLSKDLGLAYTEPVPGERIQGVYRRPIDLAGGRYALIENSREFALVPWRPVLEKHIDRYVSGIDRGGSVIDWTIGRQRGLSI